MGIALQFVQGSIPCANAFSRVPDSHMKQLIFQEEQTSNPKLCGSRVLAPSLASAVQDRKTWRRQQKAVSMIEGDRLVAP